MAAGLIPIPPLDFAAVFGIQLKMVSDLAKQYGVSFSEDRGRAVVSSLVGGAIPAAGGSALASAIKFLPVVGTTVGAIAVPGPHAIKKINVPQVNDDARTTKRLFGSAVAYWPRTTRLRTLLRVNTHTGVLFNRPTEIRPGYQPLFRLR